MSKYIGKFSTNKEGGIYTLIVRIDNDGEESVIHGYKGRYFKKMSTAKNSVDKYLKKTFDE